MPVSCLCGFENTIIFRKPDHFTPSTGTYICGACNSKFQYRFAKAIGKPGEKRVTIQQRILVPTEELIQLLAEDYDKNFKVLEDIKDRGFAVR